MSAGQVITGGVVSITVTVKEHDAVPPAESLAVTLTVVVPNGNADPDGGFAVTTSPGHELVAVTANPTTAPQKPGFVLTVMLAGHVITGPPLPPTVIVAELTCESTPAEAVAEPPMQPLAVNVADACPPIVVANGGAMPPRVALNDTKVPSGM